MAVHLARFLATALGFREGLIKGNAYSLVLFRCLLGVGGFDKSPVLTLIISILE